MQLPGGPAYLWRRTKADEHRTICKPSTDHLTRDDRSIVCASFRVSSVLSLGNHHTIVQPVHHTHRRATWYYNGARAHDCRMSSTALVGVSLSTLPSGHLYYYMFNHLGTNHSHSLAGRTTTSPVNYSSCISLSTVTTVTTSYQIYNVGTMCAPARDPTHTGPPRAKQLYTLTHTSPSYKKSSSQQGHY